MPGGTWSTSQLPVRSGTYIDFIAAVTAAFAPGTVGSVAVIGTADWGPANQVLVATSQGQVDAFLGGPTYGGSLRDASIQALAGFDIGGAVDVLMVRAVSPTGAAANLTLNDGSASPALILTATQMGIRANNWTITVQSNVAFPGNSDMFLYEAGKQIGSWLNVAGGTNDAFASAITRSGNPYVTAATSGTTGRKLANIVGSQGGTGGFAGGNSGSNVSLSDYAAAQTLLGIYIFDAVALANVTDAPTQDQFVAWVKSYNATSGYRTFGVIGGSQNEALTTALARSSSSSLTTGNYDTCDVVNAGATDLLRISDGTVLSTAYLAPRIAGAISSAGLKRGMAGVTWTGYRVNNPLSNSGYESTVTGGVFCFRQDDPVTISVEKGVTAQVTSNTTDRPVQHGRIRNVMIAHFIANNLQLFGNAARGSLLNVGAARAGYLGNILQFLKALETRNALQPGSTVTLDNSQDNTGSQLFIQIGITYLSAIDQFFFTIAVGG